MGPFNVRVYGILKNSQNEVLVSDEFDYGKLITKFPGGGLEYGEGTVDGLKREFVEECDLEIEIIDHFYTTDFFVKSAFNDSQVIGIFYLVKNTSEIKFPIKKAPFDFDPHTGVKQAFRMVPLKDLKEEMMTFEIEKKVVSRLKL